jgi:SAM-dependent methyltransferase
MVRDALRKLDLNASSEVLEVGCGTGIFAIPIARSAARYVGTDFAGEALGVLESSLTAMQPRAPFDLVRADFLNADLDELGWTAAFDRALMYAVVHYARSDDEGVEFLRRLTRCLRPGGRALVGNIPLTELSGDGPRIVGAGGADRIRGLARWVAAQDDVARRPAGWKLRSIVLQTVRARLAGGEPGFETAALPTGYTVELTRARVDGWLREVDGVTHRWLLPAPGTPMHLSRADLVLVRS